LRRLRDVLAENQFVFYAVPQPAMTQRFLGALAIGRVLGIGDCKLAHAAVGERGFEIVERAVGFQRRAMRNDDGNAAERIKLALVSGKAVFYKIEDIAFVGGQKHLERCALFDLPREIAGRSK
jgi:hypothetical protein